MTYHIRVRPTALIIENDSVLLIEYSENGEFHYNLPGGGAEPGETITDSLAREMMEEAAAEVNVGRVAFVYEFAPHKQSGTYDSATTPHALIIVFDCTLKDGSQPRLPDQPDPMQVGVRWIRLDELESIMLFPNVKKQIIRYASKRDSVELVEDYQLEPYE
ncbi:NUDIX domain-containing protein [Paenibacillus taihuensis]|uniref:NUDIX domain-containing protein n=1 Tax=Paenibacillus taihuensis TaxID=1156355 RepID=UPI0015F26DCB|nr:NUDIX domain-containing protein [Paenibacillus taihuensis]